MTQDDVLFSYRLQLFDLGSSHNGRQRVPHLRGAPVHVLPLEERG
jgi:hypothetical protein